MSTITLLANKQSLLNKRTSLDIFMSQDIKEEGCLSNVDNVCSVDIELCVFEVETGLASVVQYMWRVTFVCWSHTIGFLKIFKDFLSFRVIELCVICSCVESS
ncbi:hypothetical protein CHS0354_039700 [Potamilus streckersoni]|uniref:Uncharacterized protein n=1 Tax=Potamilus streckersoni TaxID=2493646 RepID=A0AAE0SF71_9BIVA|nr:hypothetical protein CHS0354_039700 [Potamilus streckersoni]